MMCNKCHTSPHCNQDNLTIKLKRLLNSRHGLSSFLCLRINGSRAEPVDSLSRAGSLSSRGSVRITITNVAEQSYLLQNNNVEKLDSPGATSQSSEVSSKSMADRELPKIPSEEEYTDEEHDYDMLYEGRVPNSLVVTTAASPLVDYDTIENIIQGRAVSDTPDYATVRRESAPCSSHATPSHHATPPHHATPSHHPSCYTTQDSAAAQRHAIYDTTLECRRNSYETLPEIRSEIRSEGYVRVSERRPSYECMHDVQLGSNKAATIGPIRTSQCTADYDDSFKPITKSRSGSERRARENEDTVSVIYASINPESRTRRKDSVERCPSHNSLCAPPVPENPYAMLDNLLEDLNLQNPGLHINNNVNYNSNNNLNYNNNNVNYNSNNNVNYDNRIYEDLENVRPSSALSDELLTPLSGTMRRTNPIIVKSSPYAVSNT